MIKYISELVTEELSHIKDRKLKSRLFDLTRDFKHLKVTRPAKNLADEYVDEGLFPIKYYNDALHLSIATINHVNIMVSWNFEHLVRRKTRLEANLINSLKGYHAIEIIAPPEL